MGSKSMHFAYSIWSYSKNPGCCPSESVIPDRAEITVQARASTNFFAEMRKIFPPWE
jgi:hypothetical protein